MHSILSKITGQARVYYQIPQKIGNITLNKYTQLQLFSNAVQKYIRSTG